MKKALDVPPVMPDPEKFEMKGEQSPGMDENVSPRFISEAENQDTLTMPLRMLKDHEREARVKYESGTSLDVVLQKEKLYGSLNNAEDRDVI